MGEDLTETIRENAAGPAKASGDGTSIDQHTLADQIAADKHLSAKKAMANPAGALAKLRIVPPGAV